MAGIRLIGMLIRGLVAIFRRDNKDPKKER